MNVTDYKVVVFTWTMAKTIYLLIIW